jgi:predicted GH43/DUF377 family glycosyl hydrolase
MRRALLFVAVVGVGCSIITEFSPEKALEQTEERCSDGVDNDRNGQVDCADGSCAQFDFCREDSAARCLDGRDNDVDGKVDCLDSDCCNQPKCSVEPSCGEQTLAACSDGLDNDNNGLTDCADFSCGGPECCRRLEPLLAETFDTINPTCTPADCAKQPAECCSAPLVVCNQFDPQRWIAWGKPSPRSEGGAFTPNQPCESCTVSGLLSVGGTQLSPHLVLEFEADLAGLSDASLSVGLVERVVLPDSDQPCGGVQTPFPLLAGVTLKGSQVQTEVAGIGRQVDVGDLSGRQLFRIQIQSDGTILFLHEERVLDTMPVRVQPPYPWVRVLIQGHSAKATIDNLLLARRTRCADPTNWTAGSSGPGPVFSPSLKASRFDGSAVEGPSVVFDGTRFLLYYTGRTGGKAASSIGYTTSTDGQSWATPGTALTIHGETAAEISDAMVTRHNDVFLMAYRAVALKGASIAIASSPDGVGWTKVKNVLDQGGAGTWDSADVAAPTLAPFRHRLYLWYVGRSETSTAASVGLAIAQNNLDFVKAKKPVLAPTLSGINDRGVADPWVLSDGKVLHMWYVGHSWGGKTSINYAVSEDGRNWVHFPKNPVVLAGDSSIFGSTGVSGPTVIDRWGRLQMWYGGVDPGGLPSIGQVVNTGRSAPLVIAP